MKQAVADCLSVLGNMKRPGFNKPGYIGFDLGTEKLNMVQVDFSSAKPIIISASSDYHNSRYEELLAQPERLQTLVKAVFKKTAFKGREVVATVPGNLLKLLFINFTCKAHEDEADALLNALQNRIHDKLTGYVIDYLPVNPHLSEQINRMALVAMAKKDEVENYLDLLDSCGLKVAALEIGPVAIKRLISAISSDNDSEKVLIINFGTQKSYLTVLWNQELLLDRELEFGMDNILSAIARAFDVSPKTALEVLHQYGVSDPNNEITESASVFYDDENDNDDDSIRQVLIDILKSSLITLSNEIRDVLVHVASETRGGAVEQIYIMGSLARVTHIDNLIDGLVAIPVKTINPFYGLPYEQTAHPEDIGPVAGIAVATGLSLRDKA